MLLPLSAQVMSRPPTKHWTTESFLSVSGSDQRNALIILNTPLVHDALFRQIWAAGGEKLAHRLDTISLLMR